jgi:hypothetical protein
VAAAQQLRKPSSAMNLGGCSYSSQSCEARMNGSPWALQAIAGTLGRLLLFGGVQPGAVLFLHLLCRNNSAAKVCELHKLMLYCL